MLLVYATVQGHMGQLVLNKYEYGMHNGYMPGSRPMYRMQTLWCNCLDGA